MNTQTALMTSEELLDLPEADRYRRFPHSGRAQGATHDLAKSDTCRDDGGGYTVRRPVDVPQPKPRPKLYNGDIYFRLRRNPDSNVGVDVALATPEQAKATV